MQKKFVVRQIYTLLCILFTVAVLMFIVRSEIATFHFVLYRRRKYLNVDTIITQNLIPKLIFGTILIVLGIFCYVFYLSVLQENTLLIVVRFLFFSAGLISCLWEYETQFYVDSRSRIIWIKCGDLLLLLLSYTFLELLKSENTQRKRSCFFSVYRICTIAAGLFVILRPSRESAGIWSVFTAVSLVLFMICHIKFSMLKEKLVYVLFSGAYLFLNDLYYKMRTSDNLFRDHGKILMLSYVILSLAVLVYLYYYRKFHLRMCLSKDVNQKIRFANRYKYEITKKLIESVENPINLIEGLNEILAESNPDMVKSGNNILDSMNYEISRIKKSLGYLRNNSLLVENAYNIEKVKVNFHIVAKEVIEGIGAEQEYSGRYVFVNYLPPQVFVSCDPYYLADAFINIIREMLTISVSTNQMMIIVRCEETGNVLVEIQTDYQKEAAKKAACFYHLFRRKDFQSDTYQEENIYLLSARNIILLHAGTFTVRKDRKSFVLECRVPQYQEADAEKSNGAGQVSIGEHGQDIKADERIVVLIDNRAEQIALVSSYLVMEPFHLQVFGTGTEAVEYLNRTPNVVFVLIGEVFFNMSYFEICNEIRKNFSLAQLSVVLINSKKMHYMNDNKLKNFNDILEAPFTRHQFLLKLYSAVRLRQSEEELSKYRIDFLQSQMNPHFIFNTISTIMPLCLSSPMEAYSLLEYFAEYLRGNLFAGNLHNKVTLQREVDLIEAFLGIEKVRFKGLIESSIQMECDGSIPILPLLIEPLVENCIVHARMPGKVLCIRIDITEAEKGLFVVVKDNGTGMSEESIEDIYQMKTGNSFGLTNVIKRLRLYYQEELLISSEIRKGTTISFHIPYEEGLRRRVKENARCDT